MSYRIGNRVNSGRPGCFPAPMRDEIATQIRYWYALGYADRDVAMKVGVSDRTVLRHRTRQGLIANTHDHDRTGTES